VPVLTLSGRGFASRVCGSLVRSAGLPELVVLDPAAYVERAVAFGLKPAQIQTYKAKLAKERGRSTLFATDKLVAKLEALYKEMCADYRKGALPKPNLDNLDPYYEVGIEFDHDRQEVLAVADYEGLYKTALARRHLSRPVPADIRLWNAAQIAAAEKSLTAKEKTQAPAAKPAREREAAPAAAPRRKTGTR